GHLVPRGARWRHGAHRLRSEPSVGGGEGDERPELADGAREPAACRRRRRLATHRLGQTLEQRPLRGGHSISNVLETASEGSSSPSSAQAITTLPPFCRISPSSRASPSGAGCPVSSSNSRRATSSGSSPGSISPFSTLQVSASFLANNGPPGCPSNTSRWPSRLRHSRMPALRRDLAVTARPPIDVSCTTTGRQRGSPRDDLVRGTVREEPFTRDVGERGDRHPDRKVPQLLEVMRVAPQREPL